MTATLTKPAQPSPAPAPRPSPWRRVAESESLVTTLAVVISLVVGAIMMAFSDDEARHDLTDNFGAFFGRAGYVIGHGYSAMFQGAIVSFSGNDSVSDFFAPIAASLARAEPLILAGLGVTLAFRTGLFNIGAEGQILAGAAAAGYVGFAVSLPPGLHVVLAVLAGIAGGAIWGFIAGALKAKAGAHEVITTIMLNNIAGFGIAYLLGKKFFQGTDDQRSKVVDPSARLPHVLGSGLPVDFGIVLAVVAGGVLAWLLGRTTVGFRMRAVGANPAAARSAGMNIATVTMLAMALSGAFAGLAGSTLALGTANSYLVTKGISSNIGFDALTVALLGRMRPWPTVWAGVLFGVLRAGGSAMQASDVQIPVDIVTVMQSLIVVFIAAPRLTRAIFRIRARGRALQTATTNLAVTVAEKATSPQRRRVLSGTAQAVLGVLGLLGFGLAARSAEAATLNFTLPDDYYAVGAFDVQTRPVVFVLCGLVVLAGVARLTGRVPARLCMTVTVVGLVVSFILWAVAGTQGGLNVASLVQGTVFPGAIPLVLGAVAGLLGERAGVVNVAIEGQLLLGAFVAALAGTIAGSAWVGLIGGMLAGVLVAALLAVLAIRYLVDQVIVGVVLNVFVLGLTTFLFQKLMAPHPDAFNNAPSFGQLEIPGLSYIPIIGQALFTGTIFLYLTYAIVIVSSVALFRTRWGLRVRAVGEHPRAADTVGIKVNRTRYRTMWLAGAVAGLGGAFLIVGTGSLSLFSINLSAGRGFIALACVIFGKWNPRGAVLAALLFGFSDQLGSLLQQPGSPIDDSLLLMAPYLVTLLAVAGFLGRARPPAADGQPYVSRS